MIETEHMSPIRLVLFLAVKPIFWFHQVHIPHLNPDKVTMCIMS